MALDKGKLTSGLTDWLEGYDGYSDGEGKTGIERSAEAFAAAYDNYALDAEDISGDGPLSLNKQGIIDAIKTITLPGSASTAAGKFAQGIVAYWTGGTFQIGLLIDGWSAEASALVDPLSLVPLQSYLVTELTAIFIDKEFITTYPGKADTIAEKLEIATKMVKVTCSGTSGGSSVSKAGSIT